MQTPPHSYEHSAPRARPVSHPFPMREDPTWDAPEELASRTAQAERRRGLTGAWLDLVAPPPAAPGAPLAERERVRRAELSSYVLLGVLLVGLALIPNGLANFPTLVSAGIIIASAVAAGLLNRTDHTTSAALVLIAAFTLALSGALLWAPQLDLMWMPALDFFAVPVLLAAILLPRLVPFLVGAINIALITALLLLKPRDPALAGMVASLGVYHFVVRPAMLILIVAIAGWLWSRSVEQAIARADRAEEVATAEHQLARQKVLLERGIQGLLETHVRIANGDFSARAHAGQDNVLWQIAVSLNNLASRLGKWAQVDQRSRRMEVEIDRLAGSLERARQGQRALWPALSGTPVDRLIVLLASAAPARGPQVVSAARDQWRGQLGPLGEGPRPMGGPDVARAAGPLPGMIPGAMPGAVASPMPGTVAGQWREPSIQHMPPQTAPSVARPPVDAPNAHAGQMTRGGVGGADAWAASAPGHTAGIGAMPMQSHARITIPDETQPHVETMTSGAHESRRARTHGYRQVPMPNWLATSLPPLAGERGAHLAAPDNAPGEPGEPMARVMPGAVAGNAPVTDDPHPTIILDAPDVSPAQVAKPAARADHHNERAEQSAASPEHATPAQWPESDSGTGVDWPGYLRQLGQDPD